eukprot:symbB.v1.2.034549.t1/scaffold4468.1/size39341/3
MFPSHGNFQALHFSASHPDVSTEVARSRAESLEIRAESLGEDEAVEAVVTALLDMVEHPEEIVNPKVAIADVAEVPAEDSQMVDPDPDPEPILPAETAETEVASETAETETLSQGSPLQRRYSDDFEEFDEPFEYEDTFEDEKSEMTPAHQVSGGYPTPSPSNPKSVGFAETAAGSFERQVSFSEDAQSMDASTAKSMRKGTAFVSQDSLPESDEDEDEEIQAPPCERKVSFSQEGGTGFVAMRDLPESDEEDEGDENEETQAESQKQMQAEVDEIRHVSFSADTATASDKCDKDKSNRKGTGYVQISELPDDEDEEEEAADKRVNFDVEEGTHEKTSQDSSVRKGLYNLPESEDDDEEEGDEEIEAPSRATERKVSFSQEGGQDSERTRAMRQGTGFVAMRDLPESDEEDEGDENDETQAQSASSERKVSFSEAAGTGTDSQKAQATRKGTGFVSMSAIARLGSDEDTADEEVDEIRHVSFSADTATASDKCDKNKSNRNGTGYVQISELPDDEDEEDEAADKRVSFDVEEGTHEKTSQDSSARKGTGFVAMQNLPESEDDDEEEGDEEIEAPSRATERKVRTGFVAMRDLPESDEEDEGDENEETQAESHKQMQAVGTGFVSMSAIARLGSDEDTADEEVDEIRHVSFSADTATSSDKCDKNKSNRNGTGYVQISELPDDEDEEDEADKRVSFDVEEGTHEKISQDSSARKGL